MSKNVYFAADEAKKLANYLDRKANYWFDSLVKTNYLSKIKRSWLSYYGTYYDNSHEITYGGESGELVNLAVNHYRNIASIMHNMVTSTRPAFQARSVNTDVKSQMQTILANGLLEYYMREKRLENDLKRAVEYAIVMGAGYIKMEWNSTRGEIYDYIEPEIETQIDPETGEETILTDEKGEPKVKTEGFPIYEGDVDFNVLSPFDVVFDSSKENSKHDWVLCRSFKNKFDLAAKYPELHDKIVALQTKSDLQKQRITLTTFDETVDVPVYEFFHKPTESLPKGRYVLYLTSDIILEDTILPYRRLPVYRISPSDILGTPYGYTPLFDLLPIQDCVNSLYSTVMTNQNTFGVQNIYVERGADVNLSQISGGLNLLEGNPGFKPPQPLNLTQTPGEIFSFVQMLEKAMETISGINSVTRGNPEANLRTGNALALVQSQALQFISGLQQSYVQMIEDIGTGLIELLKDFASVPRVAQIAGKSNRSYMKYFTGEDLSSITRVIVDVGNALSQTTAGRVEMASQLLQMGMIKTPEEYISVINTGKLETLTENTSKELILIRAERERLVDGEVNVKAILTDDHNLHIKEHSAVLADPDLRNDPELVSRVINHIQEHINILSDPNVSNILVSLGQQPIMPMQAPMPPQPGITQAQGDAASQAGDLLSNPEATELNPLQGQRLPQPARPAGNPNQPISPEELFAQNVLGNIPQGE